MARIDDEWRSLTRNRMSRPIVTAQRAEKVQELRKKVSQGEGEIGSITHGSGQPFFVFGITPMTDDYYI